MKKYQLCIVVLLVLVLVSLGLAQATRDVQKTESTTDTHRAHSMISPDEMKWEAAPPKLPPGAQISRLVGDSSKPGVPYVFRVRLPDGYSVPPHWHPMDENVTVLKGVFMLGFGERIDKATLRELPAGSYAMLPKEVPHYNVMKGETILQFHGIGPYDITYLNPADDPSKKR